MINQNAIPWLNVNQVTPQASGRIASEQELRQELANGRKDFSDMDLRGLRLDGLHEKLDLSGCNFRGSKLNGWLVGRNVKLDRADFSYADWSGASFNCISATAVKMHGAKFAGASFDLCALSKCHFSAADFNAAKIMCSVFEGCTFENAKLQGIEVIGSNFENGAFDRASAQSAGRFTDSKFHNVSWTCSEPNLDFWNSRFTEVNFSHTDFWHSRFVLCNFIGPIEFERCKGFRKGVDCMFMQVNLLPLRHVPETMWVGSDFDEVNSDFYSSRKTWQSIICWEVNGNSEPVLSLNLKNYKSGFREFDWTERKYIREKVASILETRKDLATPEAVRLFEEIKELEDKFPARQPTPGKFVSLEAERISTSMNLGPKNPFLVAERVVDISLASTSISSGGRSRNGSESSDSDKVANSFQLFG